MNKELLHKAIDYYDDYTTLQRKILKLFVDIAINNIVVITPTKIIQLSKATRATVYSTIKRFQEDNLITLTDSSKNGKFTSFTLNQNKLNEIVQRFEMQQDYQKQE